jgi:hypothetical protein
LRILKRKSSLSFPLQKPPISHVQEMGGSSYIPATPNRDWVV